MDEALEWREKLLEQVVEMDDDAMEKYLDVCLINPTFLPLASLRCPAYLIRLPTSLFCTILPCCPSPCGVLPKVDMLT